MVNLALYSKGVIANYSQIDEDDYEKYKNDRWNLSTTGYAISTKGKLLHRLIFNVSKNNIVDHINCDKLNNTKSNLRIVSNSQNSQNKIKKENLTSKFIGVSSRTDRNTWRCSISHDNKLKQFSFKDEKHAAYWYDQLALKYYGNGANINNIEKPDNFIEPIKLNKELPIGITKNGKKFIARITGKYLGTFETIEKANQKYNEEKEKNIKIEIKQDIIRNKDNIAIIAIDKREILVDDDRYFELVKFNWKIDCNGYALGKIDKLSRMHRFLMKPKNNEIVDHINGNRLDNRLSNLRISNSNYNNHNKIKKFGTSKYLGVSIHKQSNKFIARIRKDGKQIHIGLFETEIDAAKAYNKKAYELYENYANLNILL
jgi:hypothetical protein